MTQVTPHDVAEILETELESVTLQAFISDAHRIVERRCAPHTDDMDALGDVEAYVAAHLATAKDPRVSVASHESVDVEFETDAHRYWEQAVLLDPTGRLDNPTRGYGIATT
jgi:hypothetical protein